MKASERQELANTLTPILAKEYGPAPPEADRPVLETLIYSVLLEDLPRATADAAYDRLTDTFHDLNEIRVSTISEISAALKDLPRPELRSHRIRTVLQTVFEDGYAFTLEPVRKKTLDAASKVLENVRDLSTFSRQYTLQHALHGHAVPVDGTTGRAAVWLGLVEGRSAGGDAGADGDTGGDAGDDGAIDEEAIAESLKSAIRKADAAEFNHLLRAFATDPRFAAVFGKKWAIPEGGYDPADAPARLKKALSDPKSALPAGRKAAAKPAAEKPAKAKAAAKSSAKPKPAAAKEKPSKSPSKSPAKSAAKKPAKAAAKSSAKS